MLTQIQNPKGRKLNFLGKCLLPFIFLSLTACFGKNDDSIIYTLPLTSEIYTVSTFKPEVYFGGSLPSQGATEIRLNGVDITDEFNEWGLAPNIAKVNFATVNSTDTPLIWGALRDGTNAFQVTKPSEKSAVYFTMDMPSATIHITGVSDGYNGCGQGNLGCTYAVMSFSSNPSNNQTFTVGATTYTFESAIDDEAGDVLIGANAAATRNNLLAAMTRGPGGGTLYGLGTSASGTVIAGKDPAVIATLGDAGISIDLQGRRRGPTGEHALSTSSGSLSFSSPNLIEEIVKGAPLTVTGYLEGEGYATVSSMQVIISRLESNGALTPLSSVGFPVGTNMSSSPGISDEGGDGIGGYSLTLNTDLTFNFAAYDAQINADAITIQITDSEGTASKTWLRSNMPLYNSRLTNNGVLSARVDNSTIFSVLYTLSEGLGDNGLGLGGLDIPSASDVQIHINAESIGGEVNIGLDMPVPGVSGAVSGQLNIDVYIEELFLDFDQYVIGICTSGNLTTDVDADVAVVISVDAAGVVNSSTTMDNIDLPGIDIELDGFFCGIVGSLGGLFAGAIAGALTGTIEDLIDGLVEHIFNKDLPTLRLVVLEQYMSLAPEMAGLETSVNPWILSGETSSDVALEANLGFHTRGRGGRPNASLGSLYIQSPIDDATTSKTNTEVDKRTLGFTISDNFLNQLFMGLWESGILYIDFNAGLLPDNPFIDDALIQFASASPWELDIQGNSDPRGDIKVTVPDLLVGFRGDIYNPFTGVKEFDDYNFLNMTLTLEAFADLTSDQTAGTVILALASTPDFEVTNFSSDAIPVTTEQVKQLALFAINFLTVILEPIEIALPEVAGGTIAMGDVWSDSSTLNMTMDFYNEDVFPGGFGDPSGYIGDTFSSYTGGQNGYAVDTVNFIDGNFVWTNNWSEKEDTDTGFFDSDESDVYVGADGTYCPNSSATSQTVMNSGGNCLIFRCKSGSCSGGEGEAYAWRTMNLNAVHPADRASLELAYHCNDATDDNVCGKVQVRGTLSGGGTSGWIDLFTLKEAGNQHLVKRYNLMKLDDGYSTPGPLDLQTGNLQIRLGWFSSTGTIPDDTRLGVDDISVKIFKQLP